MPNKSKRKKQVNTWVDQDFKLWLERMKAKKLLAGERIDNLGQITEEMLKTKALKQVEEELIKQTDLVKLKMDERRIF